MPSKIQFKRGKSNKLKTQSLETGEPAFLTDTGKLYIGNAGEKVLINNIDMPPKIDTANYYAKVKANEYGQIVEQTTLIESDIPSLPKSRITGLGTAATANIGTLNGEIPVLDSSGKFPLSTIPLGSGLFSASVNYLGINLTITKNNAVKFTSISVTNPLIVLEIDGGITISQSGVYSISYHISANVSELHMALAPTSAGIAAVMGSTTRVTSGGTPPFCSCSATVTVSPSLATTYYLITKSTIPLTLASDMCTVLITRLQ